MCLGLLPFVTYEHHRVASFPAIVKFVSSLKWKPTFAAEKSEDSSRQDSLGSSESVAWCAHVESNMGDLVVSDHHNITTTLLTLREINSQAYMQYSLETNWWKFTKPALASMFALPQRYYVPERMRDSYRPRLEMAGLWHTPPPDEGEKRPLMESFRRVHDGKDQYSRVFNREKVRNPSPKR